MANPYLGEVRLMSFNFAPKGWAQCNGQILAINQNQALFALLGTMYGGNGVTTFALPNLQGRTAIHAGAGYVQGQLGGEAAHTLTAAEMPLHNHIVSATSSAATLGAGPNAALPAVAGHAPYRSGSTVTMALAPQAVTSLGGSQPHNNLQPYSVINFCIALVGIFPSRP